MEQHHLASDVAEMTVHHLSSHFSRESYNRIVGMHLLVHILHMYNTTVLYHIMLVSYSR